VAKFIPLREIERSITINCTIDQKSNKPLQLPKWQGINNQGLGRSIFIFIALKIGYDKEEICDYLTMNPTEYDTKLAHLDEYYSHGKELFETIGHAAGYQETRDNYMFFYRKLVLAENYLKYRFNLKVNR
jgi:hypothetical protein